MTIPAATFERMVALTRRHGAAGAPMPQFGSLRLASPEQMAQLNAAYNDARNKHAGVRR